MKLNDKIDKFAVDIYYEMPPKLLNDFQSICVEFSEFVDRNFSNAVGVINQKNQLLSYLLNAMEKKDYLLMSDMLVYDIKPVLEELNKFIKQN